MAININGRVYRDISGQSVSIINGKVYVDGKLVADESSSKKLKIEFEGDVESLTVDGDLELNGDVGGDVKCSGSVSCQDVEGSVHAGGSVNCGDVGGDARAGGSMNAGDIDGSVVAGGSINHS